MDLYFHHTLSGRRLITTATNLAVAVTCPASLSLTGSAVKLQVVVLTLNLGQVLSLSLIALLRASRGWPVARIHYFEYLSMR